MKFEYYHRHSFIDAQQTARNDGGHKTQGRDHNGSNLDRAEGSRLMNFVNSYRKKGNSPQRDQFNTRKSDLTNFWVYITAFFYGCG